MELFSSLRRSKAHAPQMLCRKLALQTSEYLNLQLYSPAAALVMPVCAVEPQL